MYYERMHFITFWCMWQNVLQLMTSTVKCVLLWCISWTDKLSFEGDMKINMLGLKTSCKCNLAWHFQHSNNGGRYCWHLTSVVTSSLTDTLKTLFWNCEFADDTKPGMHLLTPAETGCASDNWMHGSFHLSPIAAEYWSFFVVSNL